MVPLKLTAKQASPDYKKGNGMRVPMDCRELVRRLGMLVWARLGNCPFCIGRAFQATFVAWCLTAFLQWFPISRPLLTLSKGTVYGLASVREGSSGAEGRQSTSRRNVFQAFGRAFVTTAVAASIPSFALAHCNDAMRARCEEITPNCHANCNRSAHREEAVHACYQECNSNRMTCKAKAGCS
jgi:hypothetical protein